MSQAIRPWTPEAEDLLRRLAAADRRIPVIAKELKRTESAVAGRAYKLGIRFGKPRTRGLSPRLVELGLKLKSKE